MAGSPSRSCCRTISQFCFTSSRIKPHRSTFGFAEKNCNFGRRKCLFTYSSRNVKILQENFCSKTTVILVGNFMNFPIMSVGKLFLALRNVSLGNHSVESCTTFDKSTNFHPKLLSSFRELKSCSLNQNWWPPAHTELLYNSPSAHLKILCVPGENPENFK